MNNKYTILSIINNNLSSTNDKISSNIYLLLLYEKFKILNKSIKK